MGLEERRVRLHEPDRLDVLVEGGGGSGGGRDVVLLPALLVEPQPPPAPLPEVVLPPHPEDRAHPRDAVEHDGEQRPVPEPDQGAPFPRRVSPFWPSFGRGPGRHVKLSHPHSPA